MTKQNFSIMSILVLALMFMAVFSPPADARSTYLTSCMTAANASGCHPSAAGVAGKAPTLTSTDCKCCHHHGMASSPVVTTDKTSYTSTENILFKFTGGSQNGRSGLVIYDLAGTSEVARGVIAEDGSATLSVPASVFGAISNKSIITKWHGNAINTTNGTSNVCTTQVPCTAHDFSAAINTPAITITTGGGSGPYTLSVASSNPTSGVVINATRDLSRKSSGTTPFTLSYNSGTVVTLTAPATAGGNNFQKWQKGGVDYATTASTTVTMTANTTMTAVYVTTTGTTNYKVIAFNDLGMHCTCPTQRYFSILPPFNVIRAQVLQYGANDPVVVSSGVNVSYAMVENTDTSLQADPYFQDYITYAPKMYSSFMDGTKPYTPVVNGKVVSISGVGLTGTMKYNSTPKAWEVVGIPAFPAIDSGGIEPDPLGGTTKRNPYLTANITVTDTAGKTLATTSTVVPVAFGGCCSCHIKLAALHGKKADLTGAFQYLGNMHGTNSSKIDFSLIDPDGDGVGGPIRCSWCHWDPAMGESAAPGLPKVWPNYKILPGANFTSADIKVSSRSFSDVLHEFHATDQIVLTQWDPNVAKNCYDCHPSNEVNCYRGAMKSATIWCTDCHGDLNQRIATGQMTQPWQQSTLPTCNTPSAGITSAFTCHDAVTYPTPGTWNNGYLGKFVNSRGHKGSILCSTCHGSPHAENPSTLAKDNAQFMAAQNDSRPLGKCTYCHPTKSSTWGVPAHGKITK
jgi:hypothetical protein